MIHDIKSQSVRKSKWPKSQKVDFLLIKHGEPCWHKAAVMCNREIALK